MDVKGKKKKQKNLNTLIMPEKATIIFFSIVLTIWYGGTIFFMVYGANLMSQSTLYGRESTKETCLLTDYTAEQCTYSCNCDNDSNCNLCYGFEYDYQAIAPDKCDNTTLYTAEIDRVQSNCANSFLKDFNDEYTCYVLDCDKAEFSFDHPDDQKSDAIACIVVSCICVFIPCICYGINRKFCDWEL